ncbi:MAG: VWA domain-containing protein, partial [Pseudomonadota bacterium]
NAQGVRLKCTRSSQTRFDDLSLNGEFLLSISPVAKMATAVNYKLQASPARVTSRNFETEPNDRWEDTIALTTASPLAGKLQANDKDAFAFVVDGPRQLWRIVAQGDTVASLELQSASGITLQNRSANNGAAIMENLQLPQGNYRVRLTSNRKDRTPDYTLALTTLGETAEVALSEIAPQSGVKNLEGDIEAEPNDSIGQAQRLRFDSKHVGSLGKGDTDMYRFFLPGHGRVRLEAIPPADGKLRLNIGKSATVLSPELGEMAVFEGDLLPGDHYVRLRSFPAGTGLYQLTMKQLDPLTDQQRSLDGVSVKLKTDIREVSAYVPQGQQLSVQMTVSNQSGVSQALEVIANSSAYTWRAEPGVKRFNLGPGQARTMQIPVQILGDVRDDQPVMLSMGVQNSAGKSASGSVVVAGVCGAPPVNGKRLWSIPNEPLGRVNAASLGLGATVVSPRRRDVDAFDEVVSRSRGAWGRTDDTITVDLAGDVELNVIGTIIHPTGSGERGIQLKEFEMLTSTDGVNFDLVYEGALSADAAEQSFVFGRAVNAKFAQIRFKSAHNGGDRMGLGEWKVIVAEPAHEVTDSLIDIANADLGGYDVYSAPFVGGNCCHDSFSTTKADGQFKKTAESYEWVMAFRDNRAARIQELRWVDEPTRRHVAQDIQQVAVAVSLKGPMGPWDELGTWEIKREKDGSNWSLDAPRWARYVRFSAPALETGKVPNVPQHIQIIEQAADENYASAIGEWGYTSRAAVYEQVQPTSRHSQKAHADAPDTRSRARPLGASTPASGTVLVGDDVDWYAIDVPPGNNELVIRLEGEPSIDFAYEIQDESGAPVEILERLGEGQTELTIAGASGRYFVKLFEPPRSIIFSWDTSGSVGPFYNVIDQTMKAFANGVHRGREEVNLQPFNDPNPEFLLEDWSGDTGIVSSGIVNAERKFSSSNVENALQFSSQALKEREGTRAVLLITDAETDGYALTDGLWRSLNKSRPRVFSFEISSSGSQTAQNLMQSYADVNNGFYDQALSVGDLQIGFDRATCMLRRPKAYRISASTSAVEPPEDGRLLVEFDNSSSVAADAVEVILDASGSMYQKLDGQFRYEIAKDVLDDLIQNTLPDDIGFALRVFGNREANVCRTDLEVELAPLDRNAARGAVAAIKPQEFAYTPIADSLAQVATDLQDASGRKTVVLVTDGEESCDGDVEATIEALIAKGIDVQLNVIGFDFDAVDKDVAREQFREWAALGGGEYFDATNAKELGESLKLAVQASSHYEILNSRREVVRSEIPYGTEVALPPGRYTVRAIGTGLELTEAVSIRSGVTKVLQLKP